MATELNDLHLADLHARAAAAGIQGYRLMRREQLIEILSEEDEAWGEEEASKASDSEADTDELVVVEATVLDDSEEEPVETGPLGPEMGDEKEDLAPTEPVRGVLELTRQRYGFLRLKGLSPADGDVYVSAAQARRCELRTGDEVSGPAREPRRGERHPALVHVDTVNGEEPLSEVRTDFDEFSPILPERRIALDSANDDVLVRAVDLLTPLAFGQRVLVRAAPRSGRTTLLRSLARAAAANDTARVIVLLIDERPEEGTAWREALPVAEFAIATADLAPVEHVRTAELAIERARRLAEAGVDAILLCDSLTRLAHAAGDVAEVKRLFGSGRNLAGGGSLTVIGTTVTGIDGADAEQAVITTESAVVVLDPDLAADGVTPPINVRESRISNEDQLREPHELEAARRLRAKLADLDPDEAANLLRDRIEATSSNSELLESL
jgi:transcription termination factor Rho